MVDQITTLSRERDLHQQEIDRLSTENENLSSLNKAMEESLQEMVHQVEGLTVQLDDAVAMPAQQRTEKQAVEDKQFREVFSLGPEQYIIGKHPCSLYKSGTLYIGP